ATAQGADSAGRALVGVFKSTDGGASWTEKDSGLPGAGNGGNSFARVGGLTIDPKNPSTVYVTRSDAGVFKSTDGGASWRPANSGLRATPVSSLAIHPQFSSLLYAGMYRSNDAGRNWFWLGTNFGNFVALAIDPQTPNTMYAAAGENDC